MFWYVEWASESVLAICDARQPQWNLGHVVCKEWLPSEHRRLVRDKPKSCESRVRTICGNKLVCREILRYITFAKGTRTFVFFSQIFQKKQHFNILQY